MCSEIHDHIILFLIGIHKLDFSKADKSTVRTSEVYFASHATPHPTFQHCTRD